MPEESLPPGLYPYQREGVRFLLEREGALLADEMGLGKTVQVAVALRQLAIAGELTRALIVAPVALLDNWRRELRRWAPGLSICTVHGSRVDRHHLWHTQAPLLLTSYETLREDVLGAPASWVRGRPFDVVVLDEASRIRNRGRSLAEAPHLLTRRRSWALTGTPLENRVDDLIALLEFVAPGRYDPRTYWAGLSTLKDAVTLRRRKAQVLADLPPLIQREAFVRLSGAQASAYARAERSGIVRLDAQGAQITAVHILELLMRLKQLCNVCPESGESAKLAALEPALEAVFDRGEKALVFSQFVDDRFGVGFLAGRLARFAPQIYVGGQDRAARERALTRFTERAGPGLLLLSLKAGGVGLNLQAASQVFHYDRWWNPAVEAQAAARAHRSGQTRPVEVVTYITAGTVEERIAEILEAKRDLFDQLVDGASAVEGLSRDELMRALKGG